MNKKALLNTKVLKIEELIPAGYHPRKDLSVKDPAYQKIKNSIIEFDYVDPLVFNAQTKTLIAGHQRLKVLKELGYTNIEVNIVDLPPDREKALNIALNKISGEWELPVLADLLKELNELDKLELTGFDDKEFEKLLSDLDKMEKRETSEDNFNLAAAADKIKIPVSKKGNIWQLGRHRLMCGDSTLIEDINKLMSGTLADMVFTDPPYNVKIKDIVGLGEIQHEEFAMASGEMTPDEFIQFLNQVFKNLVSSSKEGSIHYICMDWKHIYELVNAAKGIYTELKNLCVWNKDNGGMGTFYRSKHELVFVYKNGKEKHINNFELGQYGRYRTNVWDYAGVNSFSNADKQKELSLHPTVKPVALIADAIQDCSNKNNIILDLFGGSGSTLIASEQTDRICYMMEFSEKYCDVIINRWEEFTGQAAQLIR